MECIIPLAFVVACIVFVRPLLTVIAILTGNKEALHDAGSLCKETIPHKDQVYSREEMGLTPQDESRVRTGRQLEDGSWLPTDTAS